MQNQIPTKKNLKKNNLNIFIKAIPNPVDGFFYYRAKKILCYIADMLYFALLKIITFLKHIKDKRLCVIYY